MKLFKLAASIFGADDPLGSAPVTVEISDRAADPGPFRLTVPEFIPAPPALLKVAADPFGDSGEVSGSMRTVKINLGPILKTDAFAGLEGPGGGAVSSTAFRLANLESGAPAYFGSDDDPEPEAPFSKSVADGEFNKAFRFSKVEEQPDGNVMVWGIATHERPDSDNEVCDYDAAKTAYQAWSLAAVQRTSGAGQEISLGPIRYQHSTEPAGKATKITYDDANRAIWLGSVPISDDIRQQLQQGFLTGYSQGGSYAWRKCTGCDKNLTLQQGNNFCPNCKKTVPVRFGLKRLAEVSYVDSPATGQGFEYVKSDGTSRFVKFAKMAAGTGADGVRVLSTEDIFESRNGSFRVSKSTVEIAGRKRTVLKWPRGVVVI